MCRARRRSARGTTTLSCPASAARWPRRARRWPARLRRRPARRARGRARLRRPTARGPRARAGPRRPCRSGGARRRGLASAPPTASRRVWKCSAGLPGDAAQAQARCRSRADSSLDARGRIFNCSEGKVLGARCVASVLLISQHGHLQRATICPAGDHPQIPTDAPPSARRTPGIPIHSTSPCASVKRLTQSACGEQAAKRAREILVDLEDAKLAGRDYDIGQLVALRQVSTRRVWAAAHALQETLYGSWAHGVSSCKPRGVGVSQHRISFPFRVGRRADTPAEDVHRCERARACPGRAAAPPLRPLQQPGRHSPAICVLAVTDVLC